jgi:hypothetical protein
MLSPSRKAWMSAVVPSITAQEVSYESGKRRPTWSWESLSDWTRALWKPSGYCTAGVTPLRQDQKE